MKNTFRNIGVILIILFAEASLGNVACELWNSPSEPGRVAGVLVAILCAMIIPSALIEGMRKLQ